MKQDSPITRSSLELHFKKAPVQEPTEFIGTFSSIGYLVSGWHAYSTELKQAAHETKQLTPTLTKNIQIVAELYELTKKFLSTDKTFEIVGLLKKLDSIVNSFSEIKGQRSCPSISKPGNRLECEFVASYIKFLAKVEIYANEAIEELTLNFALKSIVITVIDNFKKQNTSRLGICQKSIEEYESREKAALAVKSQLGVVFVEAQALAAQPRVTSEPSSLSLAS